MSPGVVKLEYVHLACTATLVLLNGLLSMVLRLGLERKLAWGALRMTVQLLLIGFVLQWIFANGSLVVVVGVLITMTLIAGVSAVRRPERRFRGMFVASVVSVWLSAWLTSGFALGIILRSTPGADPAQAARYQIMLMFLLAASTALGTMGAVLLSYRSLFNEHHQFRHDLISVRKRD